MKEENVIIIGIGAIGKSILDRYLYNITRFKFEQNPHITLVDKEPFQNMGNLRHYPSKIEFFQGLENFSEEYWKSINKGSKFTIIVCIDTNKDNTFFTTDSKDKKSISRQLMQFFHAHKIFNDSDTEVNIIIESTVPDKTAMEFYNKLLYQGVLRDFQVYSSPERYLERHLRIDEINTTQDTPKNGEHSFYTNKDYTHSGTKLIGSVGGPILDYDKERLESYLKVFENTGVKFKFLSNSTEAELAKLFENHMRYVQLSTMNLFKSYCDIYKYMNDHEGIDGNEILNAIRTKENFGNFYPGLIGGGCIPVDSAFLYTYDLTEDEHIPFPNYLLNTSIEHNQKINKRYFYDTRNKLMNLLHVYMNKAMREDKELRIFLLGVGYKKNSPTIKNSIVVDLFNELNNLTTFKNLRIVDNYVEDYNLSSKRNISFKKQEFKLKNITPEFLEFKDFIDIIETKSTANSENKSEQYVDLILINHDNDFLLNDETYSYIEYLQNKKIVHHKIGE